MATEVELFEQYDLPGRESIRGLIDSNGKAQIQLGGRPVASYSTDGSGNVTGLAGPGGGVITANQPIRKTYSDAVSVLAVPPTIAQVTQTATTIASGVLFSVQSAGVLRSDYYDYIGTPLFTWSAAPAFMVPGSVTGSYLGRNCIYRFWSDSTDVEFYLNNFNSRFNIRVDGQPIQLTQFTFSAAGTAQQVKLTFVTAQPRLYEIDGYNMPFAGVYVTATASVWAARKQSQLVAVVGDSYTQGTGSDSPDQTWFATAMRILGHRYFPEGIGSTGYLTASPADPTTRLANYLNVLSARPDTIILALGYNDSAGSQSSILASATSAITAAKAIASRVCVLGPWTPLGATANLTSTKNTLISAAATGGVPFIDIENVINSVNKTAYTGGDNVHPVAAGHYFLGHVIAEKLAVINL
jgi:lysophospholipase L1-like esterase